MPIRALGDFDSAFSNIKEENYLDFSHLGQVIVGYDVPYITPMYTQTGCILILMCVILPDWATY